MPSGGHARVGPPPDPNALRRNRPSDKNGEWLHLPAAGRQGDPPEWPLDRPAQRELHLWEREWRRPQAVAWEARGMENQVAAYVRTLVRFEQPDASVALGTLLRGQETDLGLNIPGLRGNRWIIDDTEPERKSVRTDDPDRTSARARLQALQGGRPAS
jgi:hypothetical protein